MTSIPEIEKVVASDSLKPGCYDDEAFRRIEATIGPDALYSYARYVLRRPRDDAYEARVRRLVPAFARAVVSNSKRAELDGRCVDVTQALIRFFEAADLWCFGVNGSAVVRFAKRGLSTRYLWAYDDPGFPGAVCGHAWVVVPPYRVVDATLAFQHWDRSREKALPRFVTSEAGTEFSPSLGDYARPGYAPSPELPPDVLEILSWLPAREIVGAWGSVRYCPAGVGLPEANLDHFENIRFAGRSARQFFEWKLRPFLDGESAG